MSLQIETIAVLAEVVGAARLAERAGLAEASQAVDRCLHRIETVVEGNGGILLGKEADAVLAAFERADLATHTASEILERISSLPPINGVRLAVRIGIHRATVDPANFAQDAALPLLRHIASLAPPGHALASQAVSKEVSTPMRALVGFEPTRHVFSSELDAPLVCFGPRPTSLHPAPGGEPKPARLELSLGDLRFVLDQARPVLLLGRESGNDIVLTDARVSRQHARIERGSGGFLLIDRSANGCYVVEDGKEVLVHHDNHRLRKRGRIALGALPREAGHVFDYLIVSG